MPRDRSRNSDGTGEQDHRRLEPSLLRAAEEDDVDQLAEILAAAKANGQYSDHLPKIGLMRSVEKGRVNATNFFLKAGARPDAQSNRAGPLTRAVERNHIRVVKALLDWKQYPVDRNERDKKGRTALMTAAWKNHWHIVRLLLDAGADINAKDNRRRNVMHNLAADKACDWGDEVVDLLLSFAVSIDGQDALDERTRTPLHWCCVTGKRRLAEKLLKRPRHGRANVHALEGRQKTPLHLAAAHGRDDIAELLLSHGAYVNAKSDGGWTALHNACTQGNPQAVRILLHAGADVNARLYNGMTPLHLASSDGHVEVVKLLLDDRSVKRTARDGHGHTAFLLAAQKKHRSCVALLTPTNHVDTLSYDALGACNGFTATIVDFGHFRHGNTVKRMSVFELLYGTDAVNPSKPAFHAIPTDRKATSFRWVHLPANNIAWVEALMSKVFVEEGNHDVDGFKAIEKSFTHQHQGFHVHSHFMRPLCQTTPRAAAVVEKAQEDTVIPELTASPEISRTPTGISWESPTITSASDGAATEQLMPADGVKSRKPRKANTRPVMGKKASSKEASTPNRAATPRKISSSLDSVANGRAKSQSSDTTAVSANLFLFSPFLHFETSSARLQMHDAITRARERSSEDDIEDPRDRDSDEMLIRAHLNQSSVSLHIRRTLDQAFYHNIDTTLRDQDQVVYRYQATNQGQSSDPRLIMVDQLWIWCLGKDLIVTSFPQRWRQPRNDPLNVLSNIIEDINVPTREPVKSVYDLALVITARCTGVFDRHRVGGAETQFMDMFESSIGSATDKETVLFQDFNIASRQASEWLKSHRKPSRFGALSTNYDYDDSEGGPMFVDALLDIGRETDVLAEAKDIRDEINMIYKVLDDQRQILPDLGNNICDIFATEQKSQSEVKKRIREQIKTIDTHMKDLDRMDRQAERIYDSITNLLDLKQKHANAFEARFARDQAAGTARQSATIMVFTIVTIIFLPLSFIASFFAIQIPGLTMNLDYVSKFVFGIGFAISIPLILLALRLEDVVAWCRHVLSRRTRKDAIRERRTVDQGDDPLEKLRKSLDVPSVKSGSVIAGRWTTGASLLPIASRSAKAGASYRSAV